MAYETSAETCMIVLEGFEGPLQLLLHLINRDELDIENLPLARVAEQYLDYIIFMEEMNIDLAAEFLVMAAELLRIKSRLVLPTKEVEELPADDPAALLVRRLKEYSAYKEAADILAGRREEWIGVYTRPAAELDSLRRERPKSVEGLSFFDLIDAFRRVLESAETDDGEAGDSLIVKEQRTVARSIRGIMSRLGREGGRISFNSLFEDRPSRREVVVTLLALLELMRDGVVQARQKERFGEIEIVSLQVTS